MIALDILFLVAFCVALIVGPIAWIRMLKAKSQTAYLRNVALFVGPILVVFVVAALTGKLDGPDAPNAATPELLAAPNLTLAQIILLSVAGTVWIGGGNLLFYKHTQRLGRSWWSLLNPLQPQFRDFTAREWAALGILAGTALALAAVAMSIGPQ